MCHEPAHGTPNVRLVHRLTHRAQAAQDVAGAVDIIDSPAPIPGTVWFLIVLHKAHRLFDNTVRAWEADEPEQFEGSPSQVARAGVEHRLQISKRDLIQNGPVVVDVKSPPAAVVALHAEQPLQTALHHLTFFLVRQSCFMQGNEHCSSVVVVRIEIVVKLK